MNVELVDQIKAGTANLKYLCRADLSGADLCRADLSGADLSEANLSGADLSGANLCRADLSGADLSGADLSCVNLCYARLSGADLSCVNLCYARLYEANLPGANLSRANLSYARLYEADLSIANLRGANLRGANLCGANLCGANLRKADLSEVNLHRSDLSGAEGLLSAPNWILKNFLQDEQGIIVYKIIGNTEYPVPDHWDISVGSVIEEVCNPDRTCLCDCGVNFATKEWCDNNYGRNTNRLWRCRIAWMDLAGVVVPYNTDGKARCERLTLLELVI